MPHPVHTPYDGSTQPFTIGLQTLDLADWIEVDERLAWYLAEKDTLLRDKHDLVFQALDDTREAQSEVLDLLWLYLPQHYPEIYTVTRDTMLIHPTSTLYRREDWVERPLELASRLVQDDLVIMRQSEAGHRLVAASLCFPSSWSLKEKFGHPMAEIHRPVPGFQRGTRIASMIERIFSNLQAELPVERFNWSLYDDPKLYYAEQNHARGPKMWTADDARAWIRAERQTLRRLPVSGDILFTIKICVDPVTILERLSNGPELAQSFADQIATLDDDQIDYKGLGPTRDDAIAWLRRLADGRK